MKEAIFLPNTKWESNTRYIADRDVYDIYPEDIDGTVRCWYTIFNSSGKPLESAFILRDLENVCIDLNGAKLVFHGRIQPFALFDCKNITFKNFSVDYDRPFFTQGTVVDYAPGVITIDIPEEFRYRLENGYFTAVADTWEHCLNRGDMLFAAFDPVTGNLSPKAQCELALIGTEIFPRDNPPMPIRHLTAEQLEGRKVSLSGFSENFVPNVGDVLAFTHEDRRATCFLAERCANTVFENIRLLHCSAMGCTLNLCHNLTFKNFSAYLDEKTSARIISVNADIIHGFHCTGKVDVQDCRFESMLDDPLNIHGQYTQTQEQLSSHEMLVSNPGVGQTNMEFYMPGDQITVYQGHTQQIRALYTIIGSEFLENNMLRVQVAEEIVDFSTGDVVESSRMPEIHIKNCVVAKARGLYRLQSRKRMVMENCTIVNSAVLFTGDTTYWYENTGARDCVLRNNRFISSYIGIVPEFEATEQAPYYHENIRVENNVFENCGDVVFRGHHAKGLAFINNRDENGNLLTEKAVKLTDCADCLIG